MRFTTMLRSVLAVRKMVVDAVLLEDGDLVVAVHPANRRPRCGKCGAQGAGYDSREERRWRHVSLLATRVWLAYAPRRVDCGACGVTTEAVPWAAQGRYFTAAFEELVAYLAQVTDKTAASRVSGIAWATVGTIVERVVRRQLDAKPRFQRLRRIGIDEFSYRKHHRYVTTVVDHAARRVVWAGVVWAGVGKGAQALGRFLEELGADGRKQLTHATIDMSAGHIKALREKVPHVEVVFDRFHVEKLAQEALDEVMGIRLRTPVTEGHHPSWSRCSARRLAGASLGARSQALGRGAAEPAGKTPQVGVGVANRIPMDEVRRTEVRRMGTAPEARAVKGTRFSLLKGAWNLTRADKDRLAEIQRSNAPVFRGYLLKETLADALEQRTPALADPALREWLGWATRSRFAPFVRLARTERTHYAGVVAYVTHRMTNGVVEGINNRLRMIARRAYGLHGPGLLISMLFLCCGGITLNPPLPTRD